jgi:hypothetical protein
MITYRINKSDSRFCLVVPPSLRSHIHTRGETETMSALRSDFFGVNSSNPIRLALDTKDYRPQIVNDNYFVILDNVLTPRQCQKLIAAAEQNTKLGWNAVVECEEGMEVRKCQRIMWDNQEIVTELWAKIESTVPELLHRRDGTIAVGSRKMVRLNERMRFLKYQKGEYFDGKNRLLSSFG